MAFQNPAAPRSFLLLGYCGNQNTGSDVRTLTVIDDIRAVFGPQVVLTVISQNAAATRGFVVEEPVLAIEEIPFSEPIRFGWRLLRQIMQHDAVILTEGSALQQNFSSWLLYAFLWAALAARLTGRTCIAYAVDVGELSRLNRVLTLAACRMMDLIIVRSQQSFTRLRSLGFQKTIHVTTDTAFQFLAREPAAVRAGQGPQRVGIAPMDFSLWPVRFQPFGRRINRYRWPYHFSTTEQGRTRSAELVAALAELICDCLDERQFEVTLFAMESVDQKICERVLDQLDSARRCRVRLVTPAEAGPVEMTRLLRGLDFLISSRYHACVLSLGGAVPQMAIAHDERIVAFYRELGLPDQLLLSHADNRLRENLPHSFAELTHRAADLRQQLPELNRQFQARCAGNREILRAWANRSAVLRSGEFSENRDSPARDERIPEIR